MLAGSLLLAAVAVNLVIAWLIVLAGMAHLIAAQHAHRAGSFIWRLMIGLAYLFLLWCIPDRMSSAECGLTPFRARIAVVVREHLRHRAVFSVAGNPRLKLGSARRGRPPDIGTDDLRAVAVDCCVVDRRVSRHESGHQRPDACDALSGRPQLRHSGTRANKARRFIRKGLLERARVSKHPSLADL
jgi:hypothetical protein